MFPLGQGTVTLRDGRSGLTVMLVINAGARAAQARGPGPSAVISDGLRRLQAGGRLPAAIDADHCAITLLAALQGGLLLAQVQQDARPLETAVDTLLALLARSGA